MKTRGKKKKSHAHNDVTAYTAAGNSVRAVPRTDAVASAFGNVAARNNLLGHGGHHEWSREARTRQRCHGLVRGRNTRVYLSSIP